MKNKLIETSKKRLSIGKTSSTLKPSNPKPFKYLSHVTWPSWSKYLTISDSNAQRIGFIFERSFQPSLINGNWNGNPERKSWKNTITRKMSLTAISLRMMEAKIILVVSPMYAVNCCTPMKKKYSSVVDPKIIMKYVMFDSTKTNKAVNAISDIRVAIPKTIGRQ